MQRDPNRYADGLEASALRARIQGEEVALDVLRTNYERALQEHADTEGQFRVVEEQYLLHKALREDSLKYVRKAKSQHDAQAASIALERVLLHPIRKTPLEILAYIFELCIDELDCRDELSIETNDIRNRQLQPFRLAAVCRRWRQASVNHPRAWRHLECSFDSVTSLNAALWSRFLATILSRARAAPLVVCLTRRLESKPHHADLGKRIAEDVMPRCIRAQIVISNLTAGDSLLPLLTVATTKLTEVLFRLPSHKADAVIRNTQLLPSVPALNYFRGQNIFNGSPLSLPLLQVATIDHMSSTDQKDALRSMLSSSPQLEFLSLFWPVFEYEGSTQNQLVVPQLKALVLQVDDDCPLERLSSRFVFPSMTDLTLWGDPPSTTQRLRFLQTVAGNSSIEELFISDIGDSFSSFLGVLPSLGNLRKLDLEYTEFTNGILLALRDALCPRDRSAEWACRHLIVIRFKSTCKFTQDCDPDTLTSMIASRGSAAQDNALDPENRPTALRSLSVERWKRSGGESIQAKINRAIKAAL